MIIGVVSTQKPASGFASLDVQGGLVYAPPVPWNALRDDIVSVSVGIPGDLTKVLDRFYPGGPGSGFPLDHRGTYELVGFQGTNVALQAARLAICGVKDAPAQTALVAAYSALATQETVGYAVHVVDMAEHTCQREYVMFKVGDPRTKGVGMQATLTWDRLMPRLGVETLTMTAAYVGRLVWALEGFDFDSDATRAMMRERFARFMQRFGLAAEDLVLRRDDGAIEPFTLDALNHAWDFAHVVSSKGPIGLPTRTSDGQDDAAVLEVGRAFMLGDFRKPELADCVCPDYSAQRPTDPESPNQRQARVYGAAREAKRGPR